MGMASGLCTGNNWDIRQNIPAQTLKESTVQVMAVTLEHESVGLICWGIQKHQRHKTLSSPKNRPKSYWKTLWNVLQALPICRTWSRTNSIVPRETVGWDLSALLTLGSPSPQPGHARENQWEGASQLGLRAKYNLASSHPSCLQLCWGRIQDTSLGGAAPSAAPLSTSSAWVGSLLPSNLLFLPISHWQCLPAEMPMPACTAFRVSPRSHKLSSVCCLQNPQATQHSPPPCQPESRLA